MSEFNTLSDSEKLDSELLRTFIAVAETGSFTKASARIFRSQSAASLQIKRLETLLGLPVFERQARGVLLTPLGEKLLPVAQRVVSTLDSTLGELKADALTGSIRIRIPDEYGETVLPGVIAGFAQNHPQVEINVCCSFSTGFPDALARGDIDLAVYAVQTRTSGTVLLRTEKTRWATSRNHRVHEQDPVPIALYDRACWWRDQALESLEKSRKRYKVVYTSESVTGIMAAISAGVAVGLVSESMLRSNMMALTRQYGFPTMPPSSLILDKRETMNTPLADVMSSVIKQAFA